MQDYFGYSVSVDGDTMVVGEWEAPHSAHIFERDAGGNWHGTKVLSGVVRESGRFFLPGSLTTDDVTRTWTLVGEANETVPVLEEGSISESWPDGCLSTGVFTGAQ